MVSGHNHRHTRNLQCGPASVGLLHDQGIHTLLQLYRETSDYKAIIRLFWATVKAGTQERGTERGTEVIWLHTGNYTRQEARSTVASQQLLRVTA